MTEMTSAPSESQTPQVGRNEPCPCGSKKKYKRCHGVDAAPKLSISTQQAPAMPAGFDPSQFDPNQFDPNMMLQFSQMMSKLPKGQLQKLQNLMQKAMAGKDVTREAKEFETSLPVEFQTLLGGFQMPAAAMGAGLPDITLDSDAAPQMTEEQARAIVDAAAKDGKISSEEAGELLKEPKGVSKLWKKFSGK
jgi:hypothetical protein